MGIIAHREMEMGKMRILYLSSSRFPTEKAYGYQIVKECESLAAQGLDVTLIIPELAPRQARHMGLPRKPDLFKSYSVRRNFLIQAESIAPFLDPWYSDMSSIWFLLKILFFAIYSIGLVRRFRGKDGIIVWTQDFFVILAQLLGRTRKEDVLVFECHGVSKKPLALFAMLFRKVGKIIVTTSGLKKEFLKIGYPEKRITVLPNAVAVAEFSIPETRDICRTLVGLPQERPIIGYIGKFYTYGQEKGIDSLIQCLSFLVDRYSPPVLLLCVGGPLAYAEKCYRIADEAGVPREMIQIADFQPRSQVPRWMKACDVCAIPYPPTKTFINASPMKLFEYMAAGVPVIASDLPAIRDIIHDGKNGLLIPSSDIQKWAMGIMRILDDRPFAANLVREGFETVKNNSWEQRAAQAFSFIAEE